MKPRDLRAPGEQPLNAHVAQRASRHAERARQQELARARNQLQWATVQGQAAAAAMERLRARIAELEAAA